MNWVVTLLAVIAYGVGCFVPVPGVDNATLRHLQEHQAWSALPFAPVSIFGTGLGWLLAVRGALAAVTAVPSSRKPEQWRQLAFGIYILGSALGAIVVLSPLTPATPPPGLPVLVESPRLAVVTLVTGAAAQWELASIISRRGAVHGPLFLFGISRLGGIAMVLAASRSAAATYETGSIFFISVLWLGSTAVVLMALAVIRPRWPAMLFERFEIRSIVDAALIPVAAGAAWATALSLFSQGAALLGGLSPSSGLSRFGAGFAVLNSVALIVWLKLDSKRRQPA